jgi:hypothetical protein
MPVDFFRTHSIAERYVWVAFFQHTGWEIDKLFAASMSIVLNLVETIHLKIQASSLEQALDWADECRHYAEIKG